jgi:hypothetical protein
MHPTTYEYLATAHIQDLRPARTWPSGDRAPDRRGFRATSRNFVHAAQVRLARVPVLRGLGVRTAAS